MARDTPAAPEPRPAEKVRNVGLPEDYPNDAAYRTSFTGIEFARIHIPCRRDRFTDLRQHFSFSGYRRA